MKYYKILKELINSNKLKLYFVLSVPRSHSTAIHIALTQALEIDGQLNEPFINFDLSPMKYDVKLTNQDRLFDDGCKNIVDRYNRISTRKSQVKLLVHEQLCHLTKEELPLLLKLSDNIIILLRHPLLQGFSYFTRFINMAFISTVSTGIKGLEVRNLVSNINNSSKENLVSNVKSMISKKHILLSIGKEENSALSYNDILSIYNTVIEQTVWALQSIWAGADYYLSEILKNKNNNKNLIICDSTALLKNPKQALKNITSNWDGISFSYDMINNWTKGIGQDFYTSEIFSKNHSGSGKYDSDIKNSGWIGDAIMSTGLTKSVNHFTPVIKDFPVRLQEVISVLSLNYEKRDILRF